uniref:Uncharacterized protein n=1 Tax=Panagrolaimus sp. ES5 TaxID=591445 RepID=A0AC34FZV3_9BILA
MDDNEAVSSILDNESRGKRSSEELFAEILESIEEYTYENVGALISNKSKVLTILKTHRPIKIGTYHHGLLLNLREKGRLIVFEFKNKSMVREYCQRSDKNNLWECTDCRRQYVHELQSSRCHVYLVNGIVFIPLDHACKPRDYEIVMQFQKYLEEGDVKKARSMIFLINFTYGESSLANVINVIENKTLPTSSISAKNGKINENKIVTKTSANSKRKLNNNECTTSSPDKPSAAKKSKGENKVSKKTEADISSNHKNIITMLKKETTTPIPTTSFLFEKPSTLALKRICSKMEIQYCKEAMNFWKEIKFTEINTVSTNIQTQKFKTKNFYKILSNFFTGKFCDYSQIYYAINMAFGEKLVAENELPYEEIELLCSKYTVTERHFEFIAKFIPCRILIFDSENKEEPRKYGRWENGSSKLLTLVLSFLNRKYSVIVDF